MSCVYKLTFPNDAVYIGKTMRDPEERWMNGWGYKDMPLVFNCIIRYGWENVKKEILADGVTSEEATEIELKMIQYYSRIALAQSEMHSEDSSTETAAQSGLHSDAQCAFLLNDLGVDPEYTMKQQEGFITPDGFVKKEVARKTLGSVVNGHHVGAMKEHIVPIVEKPRELRSCPVKVYNTDGEMLAIYPSIKVASQETGISQGDITTCCKGRRANDGKPRYQSKGLVFRYAPYVNGI